MQFCSPPTKMVPTLPFVKYFPHETEVRGSLEIRHGTCLDRKLKIKINNELSKQEYFNYCFGS